MFIKKNNIFIFFIILILILITDLTIYLALKIKQNKFINNFYLDYSQAELDKKQVHRLIEHGGECKINSFSKSMQWHPRFGFHDYEVNLNCLENLFNKKKINIIFFGGSVMANDFAPNYLTSLEYYMKSEGLEFNSINLATTGARLSNNLSRFIEYIPKLKNKPDYIIFLDGYNEFTSIKYGGKPENDFYWTAGVERRIHKPFNYYIDLILERSFFLSTVNKYLIKYNSRQFNFNKITADEVKKSAEDYIYRKEIILDLCSFYQIKKCIFILQPSFILSSNLNSKTDVEIRKNILNIFPQELEIYQIGYQSIMKNNKDVYNLSNILDGINGTFYDYCHFNKKGYKILANHLVEILKLSSKK